MGQNKGINIGEAQGYSPLNITVGHAYAGGASGLHNFPLTMSVTGFPIANTEPIIRLYDDATSALLAEARFNYGDDISSAVPLFDNNFVANFQAYFQAGSQIQDSDTLAFAKKPWAIASGNSNIPHENGAINLRLEVALNIGGVDNDVADINRHNANMRLFNMAAASVDFALGVRYNFTDIRVFELATGNTKLITAAGYQIISFATDYTRTVNGQNVIIACGNIPANPYVLLEFTFDGVDDWVATVISDPLLKGAVTLEVDSYIGREINGRPVIFGSGIGSAPADGSVADHNMYCFAWDGAKYVQTGINDTVSRTQERGWSIQVNSVTGDIFVAMHFTPGTQPPRMRRFFWSGGDVTLEASWSTNNTIASGPGDILTAGKLFQDSTKMAREGKMRVVGYDGVLGLTGGSIPMFYIFGGNTQAAANDLAKEIWNGAGFTRTILGAGWGNNAAIKSDGMMMHVPSGKIYTSSTPADDRLREIEILTEVTRQVQIFGTFSEFVTF